MSIEKELRDLMKEKNFAKRNSLRADHKVYIPPILSNEIVSVAEMEPKISISFIMYQFIFLYTLLMMFTKVIGWDLDYIYIFGPIIIYFVFEGMYFVGREVLKAAKKLIG